MKEKRVLNSSVEGLVPAAPPPGVDEFPEEEEKRGSSRGARDAVCVAVAVGKGEGEGEGVLKSPLGEEVCEGV